MSIHVRFFASLRESLDIDTVTLHADANDTVDSVWHRATDGATRPNNTLCAINMEYVNAKQAVSDGDEVAFFPPVTGG